DNGNYEALGVTKKGNELIKKQKLNFSETRGSLKHKISTSKTMPRLRELLLDPELLKEAIKWSWRNRPDIWENLAGKCLGCGICTYVCPLCHCFSVEDKIELSGDSCKRCRKWDACTLPGFAKVTGGHNFHQSIKERYYNWFYHKFVRGYLEFGKSQCVACGKCKEHCPAGIDIEDVIIDAVSAYRVSEA
ncbi:MAG: 4Fe-4S dicluster domain-containing protein, partial [Calditrichia bacterium]